MASYQEKMRIHGILMLLGWGFFLPVGIFVHAHSKKSWNHQVFGVHFHMVMGTIGLILALAGFGYAVKNFSALEQVRMNMLVLLLFPSSWSSALVLIYSSRRSSVTQKGVGDRTDPYEYAHAVVGTIATAGMILQVGITHFEEFAFKSHFVDIYILSLSLSYSILAPLDEYYATARE